MSTECRATRRSGLVIVLVPLVTAAAVLTAPGCRTVEATAEIPGNVVRTVTGTKPAKPTLDPVALQQEIFRFCDEITAFSRGEFRRLRGKWPDITDDRLLESQINLDYRLLSIASGPNAYGNLIDLTFAIVLVRHQVETFALPRDPEGHLAPTLEMLKEYQRQVLGLVDEVLGEEQRKVLRENIASWLQTNVTEQSSIGTRYPGPISDLLAAGKAQRKGALTGLIDSLMLDPFAGLDPTVREITQTRLFAERAMYVAQRMPRVLELELELAKNGALATPEIARLLTNLDTVTRSIERVSLTLETLPDRLRDEREGLTELVRETGRTLDAGSKAMEKVNTVVLSTDTFLGHLGVGDAANPPGAAPAPAPDGGTAGPASAVPVTAPALAEAPAEPAPPPGEPFRIQDYTAAAAQLAETSDRLNTLVTTLDRTLATATSDEVAAKVDAASQAAVVRSREVVDHAFRRGLLFVALSCLMVLVSVLGYRLIMRRAR